MKATKPFAKEVRWRTWYGLLSTMAVHIGLIALGVVITPWWGKLAVGVFIGLMIVRMFILFHDYCHGAIFRGGGLHGFLGKVLMVPIGWYTLAVPSVWRETHNYHHVNNSKLTGSSIGSYPIVSLGVYKVLKPKQRTQIKFVRHPLTIALALFTTFALGMVFAPFMRDKKQHWTAPVALVAYIAVFAALFAFAGWQIAVFLFLIPGMISSAAGAYLFYAQHNFPDAEFRGRREWDFQVAALKSSSMFDMTLPMHWFTGNIGYHHVHHLNHYIPWYRLPEAYKALPELQNPGRTSFAPRDVLACLRSHVWDADQGRMVGFREADRALQQEQLAAK